MPFAPSRRTFVASALSVGALAHEALPASARSADASPLRAVSGAVPFAFDRAAFAAILERPYPHRQVAAPQNYADATVMLRHFSNALAAYADPNGFAAGPKSLHCAAVLYAGRSMNLIFNDAMYAKYPLGLIADEEMRPKDTSARAFWTALKTNTMRATVATLVDSGTSFFVCNNALSGFSVELAHRITPEGTTLTRETVVALHDELAANFLPGTMLVPAGVGALIATQEARFTYLP